MANNRSLDALEKVAQLIFDKKGFNIIGIDVSDFSSMTDFFLVAEGTVARHVLSLAKNIVFLLDLDGLKPIHIEGQKQGDWIVLDYGDFVIHLMDSDMREKYHLEEIWKEGKIVDLKLKVTSSA